jgi:hypothetical protein
MQNGRASVFNKLLRRVRSQARYVQRQLYYYRLRRECISKREFLTDLRKALEDRTGYAAGKIGKSPQHWMYYEVLLAKEQDKERIRRFETDLAFHGLKQSGVFPQDPRFYLEFNRFYIDHVRNLDCLGVFFEPWELEMVRHYALRCKLIAYPNQEPFLTVGSPPYYFKPDDLAVSKDEGNGYLQYFRNKKILLVCPFAGFLKQRAKKEIFEAAWSKTGIKWFEPQSVEALELPYGFASETHKRFGTAIDLFHSVTREIDKRDFDLALIGAAGLAVPIASHIKRTKRIGIDLGGSLQIIFGVFGKRWLEWEDWKEAYFNDCWARVPDHYQPGHEDVCDSGAYW